MQESIPLVKIASDKSQSGFLWINEPDFDPAIHARYDEAAAKLPSLTDVKGIAEKTAHTLAGAGVVDLQLLIAADAEKLAEGTGLPAAKIKAWQASAADLLSEED